MQTLCIFVVLSFHAMFLGVDLTLMKSYENQTYFIKFLYALAPKH
jgi:hypothetical protein